MVRAIARFSRSGVDVVESLDKLRKLVDKGAALIGQVCRLRLIIWPEQGGSVHDARRRRHARSEPCALVLKNAQSAQVEQLDTYVLYFVRWTCFQHTNATSAWSRKSQKYHAGGHPRGKGSLRCSYWYYTCGSGTQAHLSVEQMR